MTDKDSFENVKTWMVEIDKLANESVCKLIVGNKCDREAERKVPFELGAELAKNYGVPFLEASAKSSYNVEEVFRTITKDVHAKMQKQPQPVNGKTGGKLRKGASIQLDSASSGCC